jgi:hypothetical protein
MMKSIKRIMVMSLALVLLIHLVPTPLVAQEIIWVAKTTITQHPIETTSTPDEVLEKVTAEKTNWVLWSLVGVALLGGIAAAAGGGSSGGGGGDGDTPGEGSIPVQW